jgi:UDP-glucose 4-epimerase
MWAEDFICNDIHEFEVVVLRYGNVYGVGLDHSVVTTFVHALYNGGNPLVYGNGNQIRDYVYITDVVQVNMMAMGEGVTGVFNIASNKGYSTLDVYKKISLAMKVDKKPIHLPNNDYEVEQNVLDIQKVKKDLGWEPLVEFDEGISLTVKKILD